MRISQGNILQITMVTIVRNVETNLFQVAIILSVCEILNVASLEYMFHVVANIRVNIMQHLTL